MEVSINSISPNENQLLRNLVQALQEKIEIQNKIIEKQNIHYNVLCKYIEGLVKEIDDWRKKGWHPASDLGKVIPLYKGKGKDQRPYFTYWAEIELPKED